MKLNWKYSSLFLSQFCSKILLIHPDRGLVVGYVITSLRHSVVILVFFWQDWTSLSSFGQFTSSQFVSCHLES